MAEIKNETERVGSASGEDGNDGLGGWRSVVASHIKLQ